MLFLLCYIHVRMHSHCMCALTPQDTTLHHEPIEDQIYSLTDHLASDDVTSTDIHVQSNIDVSFMARCNLYRWASGSKLT